MLRHKYFITLTSTLNGEQTIVDPSAIVAAYPWREAKDGACCTRVFAGGVDLPVRESVTEIVAAIQECHDRQEADWSDSFKTAKQAAQDASDAIESK